MNKKYLLLPICGCILTGCSLFGSNNNNYPTIPLPPQKISESDTAIAVNPVGNKSSASHPLASSPMPEARTNQRTIQEERSNGAVTQIKVDNGNDIPDYYMYPSQQQNLNTNSTPDKNLSTPSWQISW
jgi:hypothetical protein